ncbi:unnamed protein product [Bursaphelenchus okinawaensis]|uniref:C3H1-type domain-containing protein n=1 Tax=Bursaphelenchus okinawaensis TaxID=465554 RepID=A0A811LL06_9BILA|nr:unnamed protein product [Bursaphelenchus okinawaensis]CAG9127688.1 unnamed protein product [Bursaphelenchus okinawaensis]
MFFVQGFCNFGETCRNLHAQQPTEGIRRPQQQASAGGTGGIDAQAGTTPHGTIGNQSGAQASMGQAGVAS